LPAKTSTRVWTALLVVITAGAWVMRVSPFFRHDGVLGWPMDYDEGVYVSASALMWRGVLPYRDFVFVHPPGVPMLLGLFTAWPLKPSHMMIAIRVAMTFVGAGNVLFLGLLVRRHAGIAGGLIAAVLYASYPEAVYGERGAFLEPLLNLACLCFVASWSVPRMRTAVIAGAWMVLIKSWGVLWLIGAVVGARTRAEALRLVLYTGAAVGLVLLPCVLFGDFLEHTLLFHLWRPPDGDIARWPRLHAMFLSENRVTAVVTLAGLVGLAIHRKLPIARMTVTALVLIIAAFLGSSAWWSQYDSHLALAQALVAGLGCGLLLQKFPLKAAVPAALLLAIPGVMKVMERRHWREKSQAVRASAVQEAARGPACAFESVDLLGGDVLPTGFVDPYAQMLLDAVRDGSRYPSAEAAFASEAAQRTIRPLLDRCDLLVVGWRGEWQMNAATEAGIEVKFAPVRDGVFLRK
jgi:hypothetical protein